MSKPAIKISDEDLDKAKKAVKDMQGPKLVEPTEEQKLLNYLSLEVGGCL